MTRPCFLVIDQEYASSISTRKLVIESAKFNVITAYSANEAIDTLKKFPAVDGIVAEAGLRDMQCGELIRKLREIRPAVPIIVVGLPWNEGCREADYKVESFEPGRLLQLLQEICPDQTVAVEKRNEELKGQE